jgi:hypothetical protein
MEKMVKFEERLLQVERNTSETVSSLSFITRFFWIGMSAIGATVIGMWFSRK